MTLRTRRPAGESGWLRGLGDSPPSNPAEGECSVEWAVVGAGFTGIAAARRLADLGPGGRVALLEAERVGSGPSGRNSGFVIDQPHNVDSEDIEDLEANRRVKRLSQAGVTELHGLVQRHAIDCGWSEVGKLHGAVGSRGERLLDALARGLERLGEPFEVLGAGRATAVLGTQYYTRALRTPGCVLVQPAALVRGLARCLPPGVDLYEGSPVLSLQRDGAGWRLETPRATIRAAKVILATDAFTRGLGFLRDRLVPVYTFASLTKPVADLVGEAEWGLLPAHKAGSTLRRLGDGRLLVRNAFRYGGDLRCTPGHLAWARRFHLDALCTRFPGLPIELESTWGGVVCFTRNFAPFFGRLRDGLFAAVGTNGVGIAKGTISGRLIAELALGVWTEQLEDLLAFPRPTWVPPEPFLGLGVRARLGWEQRWAGAER